MIEKAGSISIEDVFKKVNFYEIPSYQRAYTWKEEQWNNFFQDICENEEGYFLGSIICIKKEDNEFEVIDGQQRLTTISLFLNAIYFVLKDNFKSLQMQDNPDKMLSDMTKFGNLKKAIFDDDKKRLRLKLSSSGDNFQFYQALCAKENSLGSFAQDIKYKESNLFKAYEFFKAKLGGKLANKEQNLDEIFAILNRLNEAILVKITVLDEMSAFVLFESVNDRGVELSPIDLIKNLFIKRFVEEQNLKSEDINKRWQEIVDENITKLKDQIRFIRHFYNAFNIEFKFILKNHPFVTESKLIKVYFPLIKSDIYDFLFNQLIEKSRIYKRLLDPVFIEENDEYIDRKYAKTIEKINQIGFLPAYPFIMFLFSQKKKFDLTYILETLQKWNVRRQLTNFPTTSGLDILFANLCDEISKISTQKELDEAVYNYLTQDKYYLSDKNLEDILEENIYETNNKLLRYILIEIENSKRNSEEKINFWEKLSKTKFVWELEHILPQNPRKDSDWFTFFKNEKEMKKEVHKIGNITLSAYNPSLSNRSFSEKSNLENGGYKSNKVKINDFVAKQDIWKKEQIEQRGKILIDEISKLIKIKK